MKYKFFFIILFFGFSVNIVCAAGMTNPYYFAWSNNYGYINFKDVEVTDTGLDGYAWSQNAGWINMSPTNGGISNDGSGNLSGSVWGEQLGWIDFSNVSIDPTSGTFSGQATGDRIGILTFDCANCDVRTDWRENIQNNNGNQGSSSSGSRVRGAESGNTDGGTMGAEVPAPSENPFLGIFEADTIPPYNYMSYNSNLQDTIGEFYHQRAIPEPEIRKESSYVESYNAPLAVQSRQRGLMLWEFERTNIDGNLEKIAVTIEIPRNSYNEALTFQVVLVDNPQDSYVDGFSPVNIFAITAIDEQGNNVHSLLEPIQVTFYSPKDILENEIFVLSQDNETRKWKQVNDSMYNNGTHSVTFSIKNIGKVGIFLNDPTSKEQNVNVSSIIIFLITICTGICLFIIIKKRGGLN